MLITWSMTPGQGWNTSQDSDKTGLHLDFPKGRGAIFYHMYLMHLFLVPFFQKFPKLRHKPNWGLSFAHMHPCPSQQSLRSLVNTLGPFLSFLPYGRGEAPTQTRQMEPATCSQRGPVWWSPVQNVPATLGPTRVAPWDESLGRPCSAVKGGTLKGGHWKLLWAGNTRRKTCRISCCNKRCSG